jgi:hypothetical protein
MFPNDTSRQSTPREGYVPGDNAELFYRKIGEGRPVIVIHGGPDFEEIRGAMGEFFAGA